MIQHKYFLMEFRKMSIPIYFDFSLLTVIIIRPLFTTFCSCFLLSFSKKITFLMLGTWYCIRCFLSFFLGKNVFSRPLQVPVHHFSQVLSFMKFSTISSSKMFHHFFQTFLTFFVCYSTRLLLNFLKKFFFLLTFAAT